jgi:flagellar motor switch protein FliG
MFIFYKKKVLTKLSQIEEALNHSMVIPENKSQTDTPENQSENTDAFSFTLSTVRDRPKDMAELIRTCIAEDGFYSGKKNYTGYQKVAIFLIAIGSDLTNEIYKYLREDEIETITFEITRIEYVEHSQKIAIIQEFYDQLVGYKFISVGGIDYARDILEKSFGTQKAIDFINRLNSSLQLKPFDFIRRVVPLHLLTVIQQEHPQVIALILSYLEPNKASVILENLPHEIQSDVSRRIATMDRTSPEILREIERVLEKKLSTLSSEDYTTAGGVESIVEILNLVDRASEKQIIEALEDEDPELAEEIKKRMFIFEDIIMLDDRAIQKVMREVDSQELAKSLKAVDSEVQNKIFNNMSKRAANMLKEDMDYMGPVRLKDIEEAQQKIVSIVRHLDDIGEIVIVRSGEDELIDSEPFYEKEKTERLLPFEYNPYLLNRSNKIVLNDIDDETLALAVYGMSKNTKKYVLSHLNFIRRFKVKRLLGELKQVWMDKVKNAQDDIIRRIQLLESDSKNENNEASAEISE